MLSKLLELALLTIVPWIELRGSIPYGIMQGIDPVTVFLVCVTTNLLLIPVIFLFLQYIFPFFEHWDITKKILTRTRDKSRKYVEKYGHIGLVLFVAVPLPGSGAYSGALASYILRIPKKKAIPAIAVGVTIAGVLVTAGSLGIFQKIIGGL